MKWLLIVGGILVVLVLVTLVIGWSLPVKHTASRTTPVGEPPEVVWKTITDIEAFPEWRSDVTKVERLPDRDGRTVWIEEGKNGRLTFEIERREPPHLLVTRIADPSLPFGGSWTYEITPIPHGSRLTITENGEVYNPIFRVMSRFVFGHEATILSYLFDLDRRFALKAGVR